MGLNSNHYKIKKKNVYIMTFHKKINTQSSKIENKTSKKSKTKDILVIFPQTNFNFKFKDTSKISFKEIEKCEGLFPGSSSYYFDKIRLKLEEKFTPKFFERYIICQRGNQKFEVGDEKKQNKKKIIVSKSISGSLDYFFQDDIRQISGCHTFCYITLNSSFDTDNILKDPDFLNIEVDGIIYKGIYELVSNKKELTKFLVQDTEITYYEKEQKKKDKQRQLRKINSSLKNILENLENFPEDIDVEASSLLSKLKKFLSKSDF